MILSTVALKSNNFIKTSRFDTAEYTEKPELSEKVYFLPVIKLIVAWIVL